MNLKFTYFVNTFNLLLGNLHQWLLGASTNLTFFILIFIQLKCIFICLKTSSVPNRLFEHLFNFQTFGDFPDVFLLLALSLTHLCLQNIFFIISII